jgi:hypothetical protein
MDSQELMEAFIPMENLDITAINILSPVSIYPMKLPIATLSYKTPEYSISRLNIFTEVLTVHSWDPIKFRIELVDKNNFKILQELQNLLINKICQNPEWSGSDKLNIEDINNRFQPIISKNILTMYINLNYTNKILFHSKTSCKKGVSHNSFHQGQQIRIAFNFQGLLFLKNSQGNLFYRLQHQIVTVYS